MSLSQSFSQKIGNVRPLNPCPSLDIDFANGGYVNTGGFANQESVGSANFKIGAFNGPDPIFTRATAATFRGSNGLIQYAPENLLSYSEQFNDGSWGKNGFNISGSPSWINVALAPDGTQTADKAIPVSGVSSKYIYKSFSTSGHTPSKTCWSIFAKQGEYKFITLIAATNVTNRYSVTLDLSNGVVTKTAITGSPTGYSHDVEQAQNGYYRLSIIMDAAVSGNQLIIGVSPTGTPTQDGFLAVTSAGDGVSGLYIWGAQLERSSTARPYISTTTTPRYGPRFEYDLNGNPLGLLMEEQSANVFQYSEQFDNASFWTPTNITVSADQITSPSGLLTADKLTTSGAAVIQRIGYNTTQTGVSTYSIYVKAGTASFIQVLHGSSANVYANFNVSTGVAGNVGSSTTSSIVSVGNGWYRCVVSATVASTSSWHLYIVQSNTAAYGAAFSATVANLYVWGAQLEQKPFATSYMPTVGGTMTRNADVVNSTIGSWFNQPEGTIVVSGDRSHSPSLNTSLYDSFYEFGDGGGGYHSAHFSDGTAEEFFGDNGAYATSAVGITTIGTLTSIASSYSSNDIYTTRDGITPNSAASATFLATPTTLNIGYSQAVTQAWNGHIKTFRYYPKALPNNLQRLSS